MDNIYISIEIEKTKQQVTEVLNNSKLPFCILQLVMDEALRAVSEMARQEYQNDLKKSEQNQATAKSTVETKAEKEGD